MNKTIKLQRQSTAAYLQINMMQLLVVLS